MNLQRFWSGRAVAAIAALPLAATLLVGAGGTAGAKESGVPARVDNPYADAQVYVNPEWSAHASAEPGGTAVASQPTAVWLDRIAAIGGYNGHMGLRDHLDAALAQHAGLIQLVLYDLPGRDCGRLFSNGELGPDELGRYKSEFIDPIAEIISDPAYAELRIALVVEPNSLPYLHTHVSPKPQATLECEVVKNNGAYINGIGYALAKLGALGNTYNYLSIGHHGELGWPDDSPTMQLYLQAATASGSTVNDVHGFASNVSNYSVLHEEYFSISDVVSGMPVQASKWVDWNSYVDELPYAQAFRLGLVNLGFNSSIGLIVDTSRNGWGGPNRPTRTSSSTDVNTYVDQSRLDRRYYISNWCNQDGAGLGERPVASPAPGIDAYAWIKPPGESDGSSTAINGGGYDRMCDPTYDWSTGGSIRRTGAVPGAPAEGEWFSAYFQMLLRNSWPAL